jgi:aspartate/methionine/tyrosine aminotransferase
MTHRRADFVEPSRLETFLSHLLPKARHDLSTSYSEALGVDTLLDLGTEEDLETWKKLNLGYGEPDGSRELRSRIGELYRTKSGSCVICCTGAHDAAACAVDAIISPGDHAIIILPIYQPLEWVLADRAEISGVALHPETLRLDLDKVAAAITPRTRLILMNFPNSPSGVVLDDDTRDGLVALCRHHGLWLINDEVYNHLVIQQPALPIADIYERGISVDALTKGYGLAGLRVGWVACPDRDILRQITQAKAGRASYISAPSDFLARLALANRPCLLGHTRNPCMANRARLQQILEGFPELFDLHFGDNFLFACPRYRGTDGPTSFANKLLSHSGALVLPSGLWQSPFGPTPGDRIRIGLGLRAGIQGLEAMGDFLSTHSRAVA